MPAGFRYLLLDLLMIYSIFRVYSRKRLYRCNFSSKETNIYKISAKKGKLTLKIKLDSRDTPKESQNPSVTETYPIRFNDDADLLNFKRSSHSGNILC